MTLARTCHMRNQERLTCTYMVMLPNRTQLSLAAGTPLSCDICFFWTSTTLFTCHAHMSVSASGIQSTSHSSLAHAIHASGCASLLCWVTTPSFPPGAQAPLERPAHVRSSSSDYAGRRCISGSLSKAAQTALHRVALAAFTTPLHTCLIARVAGEDSSARCKE
jgi:hypothetical protein